MTKYRVTLYGDFPIEEIECDKETDAFVYQGNKRIKKYKNWERVCDSEEDARISIVNYLRNQLAKNESNMMTLQAANLQIIANIQKFK